MCLHLEVIGMALKAMKMDGITWRIKINRIEVEGLSLRALQDLEVENLR